LRAERPGCIARASSTTPTVRAGVTQVGVGRTAVGDVAGIRPGQPDHHPHRGRLAGTVRADEAGDASAGEFERQIVDDRAPAVRLREMGNRDHELLLV
jgi:hypothetical protein